MKLSVRVKCPYPTGEEKAMVNSFSHLFQEMKCSSRDDKEELCKFINSWMKDLIENSLMSSKKIITNMLLTKNKIFHLLL